MKKLKAIVCWSGGKDSAFCLHKVLTEAQYEVSYLLTTMNNDFNGISMHGLSEELLDKQAESIGIPLIKVRVAEGSNMEYEKQMGKAYLKAKSEGISLVIFGDIFLEDLRIYRENQLAALGMEAIFPLWKINTKEIVAEFIALGFKTMICCTNDKYLGEEWAGKLINQSFLNELPPHIDPCGENGEYHSFCFEGPIFKKEIGFTMGQKVFKKLTKSNITGHYWFCDLKAMN
ncbi:MAG: diphthine--ammonia ligase [Paludibacter sp.]|nr:diphthine--ammonia ligase [Paludibacter sp.]